MFVREEDRVQFAQSKVAGRKWLRKCARRHSAVDQDRGRSALDQQCVSAATAAEALNVHLVGNLQPSLPRLEDYVDAMVRSAAGWHQPCVTSMRGPPLFRQFSRRTRPAPTPGGRA